MSIVIEALVTNAAGARRAESRGARRLELCAGPDLGGTTPSLETLAAVRAGCALPVMCMVRPRGGDFVYTPAELAEMRRSIEDFKAAGAAGVVFGALTTESTWDLGSMRELAHLARPMLVTAHRAFDHLKDKRAGLEALVELGIERVLTSGGAPTAAQGEEQLSKLVGQAAGRIVILAGAGVNGNNMDELIAKTGVREVHGSWWAR